MAPRSRKVISREVIAEDLELHVVREFRAGTPYIEIRQFIPSLKEYGRGVTFPSSAGERVAKAVTMCST